MTYAGWTSAGWKNYWTSDPEMNTYASLPSLFFRYPPEIKQQVDAWRDQVDLQIISEAISQRGRVTVVYCDDRPHRIGHITEVPKLGEARPYFDACNSAYVHVYSPGSDGSSTLTILNQAANGFSYNTMVDPLVFDLGPGSWEIINEPRPDSSPDMFRFGSDPGYILPAELIAVLETWPYWGNNLATYLYAFIPTTVGIFIHVRCKQTGEFFDLSQYVAY